MDQTTIYVYIFSIFLMLTLRSVLEFTPLIVWILRSIFTTIHLFLLYQYYNRFRVVQLQHSNDTMISPAEQSPADDHNSEKDGVKAPNSSVDEAKKQLNQIALKFIAVLAINFLLHKAEPLIMQSSANLLLYLFVHRPNMQEVKEKKSD